MYLCATEMAYRNVYLWLAEMQMIEMTISIKTTFDLLLYSKALLGRIVNSFFQESFFWPISLLPLRDVRDLRWKPKLGFHRRTVCVNFGQETYSCLYLATTGIQGEIRFWPPNGSGFPWQAQSHNPNSLTLTHSTKGSMLHYLTNPKLRLWAPLLLACLSPHI